MQEAAELLASKDIRVNCLDEVQMTAKVIVIPSSSLSLCLSLSLTQAHTHTHKQIHSHRAFSLIQSVFQFGLSLQFGVPFGTHTIYVSSTGGNVLIT